MPSSTRSLRTRTRVGTSTVRKFRDKTITTAGKGGQVKEMNDSIEKLTATPKDLQAWFVPQIKVNGEKKRAYRHQEKNRRGRYGADPVYNITEDKENWIYSGPLYPK